MDKQLEHSARKRNRKWTNLQQTILDLVKEHYRLLGQPYYDTTTPELESKIKGEG